MKKQPKQKNQRKPQKHKNTNIRVFDNQSASIQQGISQISNNDSFVSTQITNIQLDPLFIYHRNILTLKHKIIRTLAFSFYKPQQYALINYICYISECKYKNQIGHIMMTSDKYKQHQNRVYVDMQQLLIVRKQDIILRFYQAERNLASLKLSKMIVDKQRDAQYIKINTNFFDMIGSICEGILQNIQKQQKQFADQKQVICKGCQRKRPYYQIQARIPCNQCGSKQIIIQDYTQRKSTLKVLSQQIQKVKIWRHQMDQLRRKQRDRELLEKTQNLQNHRVTDIDKDIAIANQSIQRQVTFVKDFVSPWANFILKKNGVNLKKAQQQFAPKRNYQKVKELGEAKKKRKIDPQLIHKII